MAERRTGRQARGRGGWTKHHTTRPPHRRGSQRERPKEQHHHRAGVPPALQAQRRARSRSWRRDRGAGPRRDRRLRPGPHLVGPISTAVRAGQNRRHRSGPAAPAQRVSLQQAANEPATHRPPDTRPPASCMSATTKGDKICLPNVRSLSHKDSHLGPINVVTVDRPHLGALRSRFRSAGRFIPRDAEPRWHGHRKSTTAMVLSSWRLNLSMRRASGSSCASQEYS